MRLRFRSLIHSMAALVGITSGLFVARFGMADDKPPEAPNGDPLTVRDVSVYLLSAYGTQLNERGLFQSTLPSYMLSRRPTASRENANKPTPSGLITFSGPPEKDIDVLLEFDNGRFLSHWPPARMRSKRLLWASVDLANEASAAPNSMPESHWLLPLRDAERLYISGNKHTDRFLLYDAELPYVPHVTLERSDNGYTVTNTGKFPVHDVAIYRPSDDGHWDVATAAMVEAAGKEPEKDEKDQPATKEDGTPADAPQQPSAAAKTDASEQAEEAAKVEEAAEAAVEAEKKASDAVAPAAAPAAAEVAVEPDPAPASATPSDQKPGEESSEEKKEKPPVGATAAASLVGTLATDDAMNAWRTLLGDLNLDAPEIEFVITILRQQALRGDSAMLVYRMDEAQLEKLMPLEVTPYPDRLFRVALVIVQDADPDLQSEIDAFIAQLGNDDWRKRETAQEQLAELGLAAKPKLEAAAKHNDAEIVFRAEQLLEALKTTP